ncbi:MAG: hypothetical protein ABSG41_06310 [Bryobacteraceae bacterium]
MPDFEPDRKRDLKADGEGGKAVETPVPRGAPRDTNSVAAAGRYTQPEVDSDLIPSAENSVPPGASASPRDPSDRGEPVDRVEMQKLREMLREQQQATLRAMHTAADLQNQLSTAQTEVEKTGKKYHGFSKQARSAIAEKTAEVEIQKLKSQQHQLERLKQEKRAEAIRAAAKVSDVQKELASASVSAPRPEAENSRVRRAMIIVTTAVAIVGSSIVLWRASLAQSNAQSQPSAQAKVSDAPSAAVRATPERPAKSPPFAGDLADLPVGLSPEPAAALNSAMTQLDSALSSFPGRDPEDILREASRSNHACRLQWNDGRPSLIFGGSPQANSLSSTITQCSEAVKKLH